MTYTGILRGGGGAILYFTGSPSYVCTHALLVCIDTSNCLSENSHGGYRTLEDGTYTYYNNLRTRGIYCDTNSSLVKTSVQGHPGLE